MHKVILSRTAQQYGLLQRQTLKVTLRMITTPHPSLTQPCSTEQEESGKAESSKERKHLNLDLYSLLKSNNKEKDI